MSVDANDPGLAPSTKALLTAAFEDLIEDWHADREGKE